MNKEQNGRTLVERRVMRGQVVELKHRGLVRFDYLDFYL